jgi:hypothetical protein
MGQFLSSFIVSRATRVSKRSRDTEGDIFEWQRRNAAEGFSTLRGAGRSAHFVFCDGEPLGDELAEEGLFDQPERWPNVHCTRIPGLDHTVSPVWMHRHAHAALDDAIRREVARALHPEVPRSETVDATSRLRPAPG